MVATQHGDDMDDQPVVDLGRLLRRSRRRRGLTQRELAQRSGLSIGTIRDLEQGRSSRPRARSVEVIADILEISAADRVSLRRQSQPRNATPAPASGPVSLSVLGPLTASRSGQAWSLGAGRHRVVLARLALTPGQPVSAGELIDLLWAGDAPQSAANVLQTHISRLRRILVPEPGAGPVLALTPGGYRLQVADEHLDLLTYRSRLADGQRVAAADPQRGFALLGDALDMWHGHQAVEDVLELHGDPLVTALADEVVATTLELARAARSLRRLPEVLPRLRRLAARHTWHESLHAWLIRALAASGQQAAALDAFAEVSGRLADELGIDPGVELAEARQAVLEEGPAPRGESHRIWPARADRTLPADVSGFVGRAGELRMLLDAVDTTAAGTATVAIHAIDGMAGVGKTTFAVHAAYHLAPRFPDGQLFVELRAHAPGQDRVEPAAALETLLQADGVAPAQIPAGLTARAGLWRDRMADRRLLLVLDDAADAAHVLPLLPGASGCLVLITSRRKLTTLPGATLLSLGTLAAAEAAALFVHRAGPRAAREPEAVERATRLCGHLPLAITLTTARLHIHPAWRVADLADDLEQARNRLAELASGDLAVAASFELSYRGLSADRQRLFRRLALHFGPDLDVYATAALDAIPVDAARRGLETLLEHNLIAEPRRGRYQFHNLIAMHARSHAAADPAAERAAAVDRLLDYYLHTATAAAERQSRYVPRAWPVPAAGEPPAEAPAVADAAQADAWFDLEESNLVAAAAAGADAAHRAAVRLPAILHERLIGQGPFDVAVELQRTAMDAARRMGDRLAEAHAQMFMADMQALVGDNAAGAATAERALALFTALGEESGQAWALYLLASLRRMAGDHEAATSAAEQSLALHLRLDDRYGEAMAWEALVRVRFLTGDYPATIAAAERAGAIFTQIGDRRGQAGVLNHLARMRRDTGDYRAAFAAAEQADALYRELADRRGQANVLDTVARTQLSTGRLTAAAAGADRARRLHLQLGNQRGTAGALELQARVLCATGDLQAAMATAEQACTMHSRLGDRIGLASALQVLGAVHLATADHPAAGAALRESLRLFREIGNPGGEAETLNHLGRLVLDSATPAAAHRHFAAALDVARRVGVPLHEAGALEGAGRSLLKQGRHDEGESCLHDALVIHRRFGIPGADRIEAVLSRSDR